MNFFLVLFLGACHTGADCDAAKDAARLAWGEIGVRHGVAAGMADSDAKERESRLAVIPADAPPAARESLSREIADARGKSDAEGKLRDEALAVRDAFASGPAAPGNVLAAKYGEAGDDVAKAKTAAAHAAEVCGTK